MSASFSRSVLLCACIHFIPTAIGQQPIPLATINEEEGAARIREKLYKTYSVKFNRTPLNEVIDALSKQFSVAMRIDVKRLEEIGVGVDKPISLELNGVSGEAILKAVLSDLDLASAIFDEILVVTSKERVDSMLFTKAYPVGDLVRLEMDKDRVDDYAMLLRVIHGNIAPESWAEMGGAGTIDPLPAARCLVVCQTEDVHQGIETLFRMLRRAKNVDKLNPATLVRLPANRERVP